MKKILAFIARILLIIVFIFLATSSMKQKSETVNEVSQLPSGYSYLKTKDFRLDQENPPIIKMLMALPLLSIKDLAFPDRRLGWAQGRKWRFGEEFIYGNKVRAEEIIKRGRLATVIFGILLGFLVFQWAKAYYGPWAGLFALFLYVFSPNILAHTRLATIDLGATFAIVLALYTFWEMMSEHNAFSLIFTGLALGLALLSKFSAIGLILLYLLLMIMYEEKSFYSSERISYLLGTLVIAVLTIAFIYGFRNVKLYWQGLTGAIKLAGQGHANFLWGKYSFYGWWDYYIRAFLIKTPPVLMILFLLRIYFNKNVKSRGKDYFLIFPILLQFIAASLSKKQTGLHEILPVYPLLYIWISGIVTIQIPKKAWAIACSGLIILGYMLSAVRIHPHYLAYFNMFAGGPDRGYKYLVDANLDWGQDLKALVKYIKDENVDSIVLSYYGTANVEYYGIKYQDLGTTNYTGLRQSWINPVSPKKEILAVSATNLQAVYFTQREVFSWLKYYKPVAKLGYSIFVYDITDDSQIHSWLGHTYFSYQRYQEAIREGKRMVNISPKQDNGYLFLGKVYEEMGEVDRACQEYRNALEVNPHSFIAQGRLKALGREMEETK